MRRKEEWNDGILEWWNGGMMISPAPKIRNFHSVEKIFHSMENFPPFFHAMETFSQFFPQHGKSYPRYGKLFPRRGKPGCG
jgi:hypothetical protein